MSFHKMNEQNKIYDLKPLEGEYINLTIDNREYGIRISQVKSVTNTPVIRKIPKMPSFIVGVANVEGKIIPVLNMPEMPSLSNSAMATEYAQREESQKRLALLYINNYLYGLMVDKMPSIIYISEGMLEPINPTMAQNEMVFIKGVAKDGEKLIYLLDIDAFINDNLEKEQEKRNTYGMSMARTGKSRERPVEKASNRYLSFLVADEEYGIHISKLNAVIPLKTIEKAEGASGYIAGIIKTTEGTFPVIEFQKKFHLKSVPYMENSRAIIIDTGKYCYSIMANSVNEMLNIGEEEIKNPPEFISASADHIKGIVTLNEGERMVMLLDETQVLKEKEAMMLAEKGNPDIFRRTREQKQTENIQQFLIFKLSNKEFAFNLKYVLNVIEYNEPTIVPKSPDFVKGIIAVKGEIITILDLQSLFGLITPQLNSAQVNRHIIIIENENAICGVLADSAPEILKISERENIVSPNEVAAEIDSAFIDDIILIKETNRTPIIVNIENILNTNITNIN